MKKCKIRTLEMNYEELFRRYSESSKIQMYNFSVLYFYIFFSDSEFLQAFVKRPVKTIKIKTWNEQKIKHNA